MCSFDQWCRLQWFRGSAEADRAWFIRRLQPQSHVLSQKVRARPILFPSAKHSKHFLFPLLSLQDVTRDTVNICQKKAVILCYLAGSKISTRSAVNASTTPAFFVNQFNNTSAPQSPVPLILSDFGLVFLCTFKY